MWLWCGLASVDVELFKQSRWWAFCSLDLLSTWGFCSLEGFWRPCHIHPATFIVTSALNVYNFSLPISPPWSPLVFWSSRTQGRYQNLPICSNQTQEWWGHALWGSLHPAIAKRDKKSFLSDQCKEIEENNRMGKTRDLFKKIRDTKGTFHAKMGTIKDRNGMDLTEAEDIKTSWQECTELYKKDLHDPDNHDGVITYLEPDILECEVKRA